MEGHEIVDALAHADIFDRDLQAVRHGDHDAALGSTVQLGQNDAGNAGDLLELPRLDQTVLAGGTALLASGSSRSMTRLILPNSFIRFALLCRRPAVSQMITSTPRALAAEMPS